MCKDGKIILFTTMRINGVVELCKDSVGKVEGTLYLVTEELASVLDTKKVITDSGRLALVV